jgi:hypothetical protein
MNQFILTNNVVSAIIMDTNCIALTSNTPPLSLDCTVAVLLTMAAPHYCHRYMFEHCSATACHHCRLEWHAYALVGTTALIGTTPALAGPPAVVKTYSAHNALPLLLG